MTALIVERCGPATTVQDGGRFGWQKFGLGPAGAMDRMAMAEANALVGNAPDVAAIEIALAGARLRIAGGTARVALAGATADLRLDGQTVPPLTSVTARDGQMIDIGSAKTGLYSYFAVAGGFVLKPQLGSVATHLRAGVGGIDGRALHAGDRLQCRLGAPDGNDLAAPAATLRATDGGPIRVMLGPQADYFEPEALAAFLSSTYIVTPQLDRMAVRLAGPKIAHGARGYNIVSDGIATGSIQVPGTGEPIVLMADRQTTGGYPKIATVITADLGRLAQMRPGTGLRFAAVTRADAIAALRFQQQDFATFQHSLRATAPSTDFSSERLLALNLIDGWTSGAG